MAKRLFLIYLLVEMGVMVALVATIGFGYTVLLLLASFVIGLALAGSQLNRHIRRLRTGLSGGLADPQGAASDSLLVALGTSAAYGLSVYLPDGSWFSVRGSNTEPVLRLNAEAPTQELLDTVVAKTTQIISSPSGV